MIIFSSEREKMKQIGLEIALELVARWFCGKRQLKVNFHKGDEVFADVKNCEINIPIAACSGDFDPAVMVMLRSNVYHESAHILLSEVPVLKGTKKTIANGLEDIRIEAFTAKMGEGIRADYFESNTVLSHEHIKMFSNRTEKTPPFWKEALFALMFEYQLIKIWKLSDKAQKLFDIAKPVFWKVSDAKCSGDCDNLAVQIYDLWKDFIKEEKEKESHKDNKPMKGNEGSPKTAEAELENDNGDSVEFVKQLISKEASRIMEDPDFYTSFRNNDVHIIPEIRNIEKTGYKELRKEIGTEVSALVQRAEEAFISLKMSETQTGTSDGELNYAMLPEICMNLSELVYKKTSEGSALNTAIAIVIDQSGSMSKVGLEVKKVLISTGELFSKLEIPFEVFGTTTFRPSFENKAFTRYRGMKFIHYKLFSENWNFVKSRIMGFQGLNNNIDGEALEYAEAILSSRSETRKIIFSICDGSPDSGQENNGVFGKQLLKTADRIRKHGTEVYAIGINTSNPSAFYGEQHFIKIETAEQKTVFSQKVIRTLINTILDKRFKKGVC